MAQTLKFLLWQTAIYWEIQQCNKYFSAKGNAKWHWVNVELSNTFNLGLITLSFKIICGSEILITNFCCLN